MSDTYSFNEVCGASELEPLLFFKNSTAGDVFELIELVAHRVTEGSNKTSYMPAIQVSRVTSRTGGVLVSLAAARSDSADLTGKVSLAITPESVSGETLIRRFCQTNPVWDLNSVPVSPYQANWTNNHKLRVNADGNSVVIGRGLGAVDSVTLAEGQGLSLRQVDMASTGYDCTKARFRIGVDVLVGGNSYHAVFGVPSAHFTRQTFVLFNESGSGVTVKVTNVTLWIVKTGSYQDTGLPAYGARNRSALALQWVSPGEPLTAKDDVTFVPTQSDSVSLSGKLVAKKGDELADWLVHDDHVYFALQQTSAAVLPDYVNGTNYGVMARCKTFRVVTLRDPIEQTGTVVFSISPLIVPIWSAKNAPIRIRPGEAIALKCMGSRAVDYLISGTIRYVQDPSVYPAVGDVDLGVQYGPNSTDYTGTLEQPAITDVLSGVQYGAGGTEFTGTATGGGGGSGVSRGRVTNA